MEYTGIIQHLQKEEGLPEFANAHGRATYTSPGTELLSPTSAWLVVRYTWVDNLTFLTYFIKSL